MYPLSLCWTIGTGHRCRGGNKKDPDWNEILARLEHIKNGEGTVTLDVIDGPGIGPQTLQVRSDRGRYVLTLGEDDGKEWDVRTFNNKGAGGSSCCLTEGKVDILGDYWDASMIFTDFRIVVQAFRDFLENGNVSFDLLN